MAPTDIMERELDVSVVVPTYRRSETLLQALVSLQEQVLSSFEVVVVDNAADPEVEVRICDFNRTARIAARYVPEPELGLHNARHAGARAAKADILVFTDDDATFDPDWLQVYADAFAAHPDMMAAGGPVRPVWNVPPPQWLLELAGDINQYGYLSLMEPYKEFRLEAKGWFYGVNMAIRRNVLFEVGGFNPDSFGDVWLGDGESGLNWKLWDRGMKVGYVPDAIVYHHIPASRMTPRYLSMREANQAACDLYTKFHRQMPSSRWLLRFLASRLTRNSVNWIRAARARAKGNTDVGLLRFQLRAARTLSEFKYALRVLCSPRFRELVAKENWLTPTEMPLRTAATTPESAKHL